MILPQKYQNPKLSILKI